MIRVPLAFEFAWLGALGFPHPVDAQQARTVYRIGVMANLCRGPLSTPFWDAFYGGLREFGYIEGENVLIECRNSEGHAERFPKLAAELVALKGDLIMGHPTPA